MRWPKRCRHKWFKLDERMGCDSGGGPMLELYYSVYCPACGKMKWRPARRTRLASH